MDEELKERLDTIEDKLDAILDILEVEEDDGEQCDEEFWE